VEFPPLTATTITITMESENKGFLNVLRSFCYCLCFSFSVCLWLCECCLPPLSFFLLFILHACISHYVCIFSCFLLLFVVCS